MVRIGGFFLFFLGSTFALAQSTSTYSTVGTSLALVKNSSVKLSYSVGQLAVKKLVGSQYSLSQGPVTTTTSPIALEVEAQSLATTSLRLYPNPVQSVLTVEHSSDIQVVITDLLGNPVLTQSNVGTHIQVGHLATGLYIIQLFEENGKKTTFKLTKL